MSIAEHAQQKIRLTPHQGFRDAQSGICGVCSVRTADPKNGGPRYTRDFIYGILALLKNQFPVRTAGLRVCGIGPCLLVSGGEAPPRKRACVSAVRPPLPLEEAP